MKILLVNSIYPTPKYPAMLGGAERFARQLAEALVARGDEVEVVRSASEAGQPFERAEGVSVHSAPCENIYPPFTGRRGAASRLLWHALDDRRGATRTFAERLERFAPDIVHSNTLHGISASIWNIARQHGVPVVHTLHDYYLLCPRVSRFSAGRSCENVCHSCWPLTIGRRRASENLTAVVGVSQRILDIHTASGLFRNGTQHFVVRNAAPPVEPFPLRKRDGTVVIGFMGRITEEKGVHRLVEALALLPDAPVEFVVAGRVSPQEQAELSAKAPATRIRFLGFVRPEEFYGQVDVVAVPSLWEEPGALVVVEALAAGRPVLGSDRGGIPEVVQHDVNGWIVRPEAGELASLIGSLAARPERIDSVANRVVETGFRRSFDDVVRGYREIYASVRETADRAAGASRRKAPSPADADI